MSEDKNFEPKGIDEIKSEVTEKFGLDADSQGEIIEKIANDTLEFQKKLGTAIKQKAKHRTEAENMRKGKEYYKQIAKPKSKEEGKQTPKNTDDNSEVKSMKKELDQLKLDALGDYSSDILKKVKQYAKLEKISYKEALKSDYVQSKIEAEKKAKEEDDASLSPNDVKITKKNVGKIDPGKIDTSTEEGQKQWDAYKKANGMS